MQEKQQMRIRQGIIRNITVKQEAAYRCRTLEESLDRKRSDNRSQRDVIHNLEAWLANNTANLISELQEYFTFLYR
jgi:hypothetical protein